MRTENLVKLYPEYERYTASIPIGPNDTVDIEIPVITKYVWMDAGRRLICSDMAPTYTMTFREPAGHVVEMWEQPRNPAHVYIIGTVSREVEIFDLYDCCWRVMYHDIS